MTWVRRLCALAPVTHLAQELARCDTQAMQAADEGRDIEGVEYQRGTLADVRCLAQRALQVNCHGRGSRSRTRNDAFGFARGYLSPEQFVHGYRTGDQVKAVVHKGKKIGTYTGRVAVRATGYFNIQTSSGGVQGIHHRHCTLLMRGAGYSYFLQPKAEPIEKRETSHAARVTRSASPA